MSRSRNFRREMRRKKIMKRQKSLRELRTVYFKDRVTSYPHGRKIHAAVMDGKDGYFSKGYYGALQSPLKTKTKNVYASHRHKGGYGKAIVYSKHDRSRVQQMDLDLKEYHNTIEGGNIYC